MRKFRTTAIRTLVAGACLTMGLAVSGCTKGMVSADAIHPSIMDVTNRHDAYVNGDPNLSEDEKRIYLRSSQMLREIVQEAQDGE